MIFLFWYFQIIGHKVVPRQVTQFIKNYKIKVYHDYKPQGVSSVLRHSEYFDVDKSRSKARYYLKPEYEFKAEDNKHYHWWENLLNDY